MKNNGEKLLKEEINFLYPVKRMWHPKCWLQRLRMPQWRLKPRGKQHIYIYIYIYVCVCVCLCCILTFDPAKHAIPKCVTSFREVTHSDGSYGKKSRRRAWLTIWDKVKFHGTVIDWCTGREWPVNCVTVISVWWRTNVPFQRYWVGVWTII